MSASNEGWTVVAPKERKRDQKKVSKDSDCLSKKKRTLQRRQRETQALHGLHDTYINEESVTNRIESLVPLLVETTFFQHITETLCGEIFGDLIVLGVGRLVSDASILQTALSVGLKNWMCSINTSVDCVVLDPLLQPPDVRILNALGMRVESANVKGKIACHCKTLFFMPHCPYRLYSNVLWSNWGPLLNNITILGNSFESYHLRNVTRGHSSVDCVRLLSAYTRERCAWTATIEKSPRPSALEQANIAFNDLSLLDFPVELTNTHEARIFFADVSNRPSEDAVDTASSMDQELF